MKIPLLLAATGLALGIPGSVPSFELATHAAVTDQAYRASTLAWSPNLLDQLGLFDSKYPFGRTYYDLILDVVRRRTANAYERLHMQNADDRELRIRGWLMRGAIREDDGGPSVAVLKGEPYITDPDPSGLIDRYCHHFFDPINQNALSVSVLHDPEVYYYCPNGSNLSAPNWALGVSDAFTTPLQPVGGYRNHFTFLTARESMWRALTLKTGSGTPAPRAGADNNEQARTAYWATTFRALGDVVHLLQDMAQPQHTRNEPHAMGGAVLFEKYIDARAARSEEFKFDGQGTLLATRSQLMELPLISDYPIPRFARVSDYWSTAVGGNISIGNGLADYSSRGFFTPRKNADSTSNDRAHPNPNPDTYAPFFSNPGFYEPCFFGSPNGPGNLGVVKFLLGAVSDTLVGFENTIRMASIGAIQGKYGLHRCVFDDRINLLIPRAVAYSAGLIDYFFRGRLEIAPPDEGVYSLLDHFDFSGEGQPATDPSNGLRGFKTIKLKLRNVTPDVVPSGGGPSVAQDMAGGDLVAVAKFHRNLAYTDDLAGEPVDLLTFQRARSDVEEIVVSSRVKGEYGQVLSGPIAIGTISETYVFEFDQALPINATDIYLQVVYRGKLGNEDDAVVVTTTDISEPSYFTYMNATDYIHIGNKVYTRDEINANTPEAAAIRGDIRPTGCIQLERLAESCFTPMAISFPILWKASKSPNGTLDLPDPGTYSRFAMLTPPGFAAGIDQSASPCLPNNGIAVTGRRAQTRFVADPEIEGGYFLNTSVDPLPSPVRGVPGWHTVACVSNGDGSTPGEANDDRYVRMAPLSGAELKPRQVAAFQFGGP